MTRIPSFIIPRHLLGQRIPLPYEPQKGVHAKEAETEGLHRMLGFPEHEEGRSLRVIYEKGEYQATIIDGDGVHPISVPFLQLVAALSYLEGSVLNGTLQLVKSANGEVPHTIMKGMVDSAQRRILNGWDANNEPSPWAGVGLIIVSHDAKEFVFARKDHLHPRMGYAGRLAFIGGNIDPNEILSDWGDQRTCAYVGMLRECFEEIRITDIAYEIASAAVYCGPARANCYLYEDSGEATGGTIRPFVARAPNEQTWQSWRRIFSGEIDGLGEANPEIVTRERLHALLAQDTDAALARKKYLKTADRADLKAAEKEWLARFSWKAIEKRFRDDLGLSGDELSQAASKYWREERERAQKEGTFPLKHRGDFAFISGHAGPVAHALQHVGLL